MDWDNSIDCEYCGGTARYIGTLALTDHYRCRNCGADHAIDHVRAETRVEGGESDAQRFAAALLKHRALIAKGGLP